MRLRPALPIAVAVSLATASTPARAADDGDRRTALMPVTVAGKMPKGWHKRMQADMAKGLTDGGVDVVGPDAVEEKAGVARCPNEKCYRDLGAAIEAPLIIRAHVKIVDRDYEVYVESIDAADGSFASSAEDTCRMCGLSEVGEMLATLGVGLHGEFFPEETPVVDTPPPPAVVDAPPPEPEKQKKPKKQLRERKWMTPAGWGLVGGGVAVIAAGATFLAIHHRPYEAKCEGADVDPLGNCRQRYDTLGHGAGLTTVGGAMVLTGVAFLVVTAIQKKRAKDGAVPVSSRVRALVGGRF